MGLVGQQVAKPIGDVLPVDLDNSLRDVRVVTDDQVDVG